MDATLAADGTLKAKVHYTMRGENELLLRVAFHQAAREKWKDVAQLMSLSDGFRGKILSASASDPYDTRASVFCRLRNHAAEVCRLVQAAGAYSGDASAARPA